MIDTHNSVNTCGPVEKSSVIDFDIASFDDRLLTKSPEVPADSEKSTDRLNDKTIDRIASEALYLNATEDWKGLTKKIDPIKPNASSTAKKRGKYLTPCPDIEMIHKRPKFTAMLPLLRNGNFLSPVIIDKQTVNVRNTCAFDCTVQSMLAAIHDFANYSKYLQSSSFSISKYVHTLSLTGVSAKLYQDRGCILTVTNKISAGVLDCKLNLSYLQEKFILRDVRSLEKTIQCADCLFKNSKIMPVLHLDPDSMYVC